MVKKRYLAIVLGTLSVQAQEIIATSGADASSQDGIVNYSIGQLLYTDTGDLNHSVWAGVQQPFEVSEVLSVKEENVDQTLQVYPNPVTDAVFVDRGEHKEELSYILYDSVGRVLDRGVLTGKTTKLDLQDLPAGVYFLLFKNNSHNVKVSKLIKK